jgi:hypothetical protein
LRTIAVSATQIRMFVVLPPSIFAVSRYAPGVCSGVCTVTRLSKCAARGSSGSSHAATCLSKYFSRSPAVFIRRMPMSEI